MFFVATPFTTFRPGSCPLLHSLFNQSLVEDRFDLAMHIGWDSI